MDKSNDNKDYDLVDWLKRWSDGFPNKNWMRLLRVSQYYQQTPWKGAFWGSRWKSTGIDLELNLIANIKPNSFLLSGCNTHPLPLIPSTVYFVGHHLIHLTPNNQWLLLLLPHLHCCSTGIITGQTTWKGEGEAGGLTSGTQKKPNSKPH